MKWKGLSSGRGLEGMELMVLGCCCGKSWGMGETACMGHFTINLIDSKVHVLKVWVFFSVLRCDWSVEERPKKTIIQY